MHRLGCVHGDVRCANIVFGEESAEEALALALASAPSGLLIDFDMGGRVVDNPEYPDGYQGALPDGSRLGRPGRAIKPADDWFALLEVVLSLHRIVPPPELPRTLASYTEQDKFTSHFWYGNELEDADAMADELVEYLDRAQRERYQIKYSCRVAELVREQWSSQEEKS
jgi:hypothetical protein